MKIKHGKITITSKIAYIAGFFDGEGCIRIKHTIYENKELLN